MHSHNPVKTGCNNGCKCKIYESIVCLPENVIGHVREGDEVLTKPV